MDARENIKGSARICVYRVGDLGCDFCNLNEEKFYIKNFDIKLYAKVWRDTMAEGTELMTVDNICNRVYIIRGQQVMLDYDLAELYGYEVKALNQQVKRNINRFQIGKRKQNRHTIVVHLVRMRARNYVP